MRGTGSTRPGPAWTTSASARASREDLDAWLAHVDGLGFERSEVTEAPHAHLFTCPDPDGTPVEFYWPVG